MQERRHVFIISDGTGITAETLGNSLITQFENIEFDKTTLPYIDNLDKAKSVVQRIDQAFADDGINPLVFMTLVNPEIRSCISKSKACIFDLFTTFIKPLETELHEKSSYTVGRSHGVANKHNYLQRIKAMDFALAHDDGVKPKGYDQAEIILVGVSRCGKTPSCIYLALQYGILAANYPFAEKDTLRLELPELLKPYKSKLFGLTIDPHRLHQIRSERRPNSTYAALDQCRLEVSEIEEIYKREQIQYIDSTKYSIEEIATKILAFTGIERKI